jgi:hypothetical protein
MERGIGAIGDIESQVRFAMGGIGSMTLETLVGENGAYIKIIADHIRKSSG